MRHLAGAILAAACVWSSVTVVQAAETVQPVGNSRLVLELQMRGGSSSEERVGVLLKSADLIRRRLITAGISNARVVPVGEDRIAVSAPGAETLGKVRSQLTAVPKLSLRLLDNRTTARAALAGGVPLGDEILWAVDDAGRDARPLLVQRQEQLAGKDIDHAEASGNLVGLHAAVNIHLNAAGREAFARLTSGNSGRKLVIVWLNKVIGVYTINQPVVDGVLPILTWNSEEAVQELAAIFNMSAMATPLTVIEDHSEE